MSTQATLEQYDVEIETVYIAPSASRGPKVYHTDESCRYLSEGHRPDKLSSLEDRGFVECKECAGEIEPRDSSPKNPCGAPTTDGGRCQNPAVIHGVCVTHLEHAD